MILKINIIILSVQKYINSETMNDKNIYELHSRICKALANPTRIEIIEILNIGELSFGELNIASNK